ncbi:Crp/Fnr family transcriptional regulator [Lentilactobacillus sp. SPB1-3]|uniref:Crp/Fnr family transcriptional regulator n=1 Tax=Lentilactobacillus terminaliae TaxID=3003483 RepID=A0ACD5DEP8_9LACO|nr:Crp/Fnr family transcriptional regulator [Lentilactobacillus sp. SPB1-3]MCZ0977529.1 Crp/Fnr family transcriptional regulator [Lentilactobacillus sp. SPB1-3]
MISKSDYAECLLKVKNHPEFAGLNQRDLDELVDQTIIKEYHRGQVLFDQGDPRNNFYLIISGIVKSLHYDENGDEKLYFYIRENKTFPFIGLFSGDTYNYSAETMSEVKIAIMPMKLFEKLLKKNSDMMVSVIQEMGQIINTTEIQLRKMVTTSAKRRVESAIEALGQQLGEKQPDGTILIPYPMTLIELSKISGTTRETTSQMVSELVSEQKILYGKKHFRILMNE